MSKPQSTMGKKPRLVRCLTCDLSIFPGTECRVNDQFHDVCMADNGMTIEQRRQAAHAATQQFVTEKSNDLKTRMILNRIGDVLFSGHGDTWESEAHHRAACSIFKAEIYIQDRAAYQEHVENGEVLQISDEGVTRWAYPGEAREVPRVTGGGR